MRYISFEDWQAIDQAEVGRGEPHGRPRVKFVRVDEMLDTVGESGTITITNVQPGVSVSGSFLVNFEEGKSTLSGHFKGLWCPTGISLQK